MVGRSVGQKKENEHVLRYLFNQMAKDVYYHDYQMSKKPIHVKNVVAMLNEIQYKYTIQLLMTTPHRGFSVPCYK